MANSISKKENFTGTKLLGIQFPNRLLIDGGADGSFAINSNQIDWGTSKFNGKEFGGTTDGLLNAIDSTFSSVKDEISPTYYKEDKQKGIASIKFNSEDGATTYSQVSISKNNIKLGFDKTVKDKKVTYGIELFDDKPDVAYLTNTLGTYAIATTYNTKYLYDIIIENEEVIAAALNDLNDRIGTSSTDIKDIVTYAHTLGDLVYNDKQGKAKEAIDTLNEIYNWFNADKTAKSSYAQMVELIATNAKNIKNLQDTKFSGVNLGNATNNVPVKNGVAYIPNANKTTPGIMSTNTYTMLETAYNNAYSSIIALQWVEIK